MKSRITDSEGRPVRWWVSPPKPKEPEDSEEDLWKIEDGTTISVIWEPIMFDVYAMPWRERK